VERPSCALEGTPAAAAAAAATAAAEAAAAGPGERPAAVRDGEP